MPTVIPYKWPADLPINHPWRSLGVKALIRRVVLDINALETRHDEFFVSERPKDLTRLKELSAEYVRVLRTVHNLGMTLGQPTQAIFDLADYFPQGIVPILPSPTPPSQFRGRLYLSLFRGIYRVVRRVVTSFVSVERRDKWGVLDPLGLDVNEKVPSHLLQRTMEYNEVYAPACEEAMMVVSGLATSRPVRRRVGDDAVFLDAMTLAFLCFSPFLQVCYQQPSTQAADARQIGLVLMFFSRITMETNRRWNLHSDRLRVTGFMPPKDLLKENLESLWTVANQQFERGLIAKEAAVKLRAGIETLFKSLAWRTPPTTMPLDPAHKSASAMFAATETSTKWDNTPDSCDYCGKERLIGATSVAGQPPLPKVLRCARCKVARYCSSECQKKAWQDGGHRQMCFDAVKLAWA